MNRKEVNNMQEPMTACEKKVQNEVDKVNEKTQKLLSLTVDILELTLAAEHFFVGPSPIASSEQKKKKKEPVGWYQAHCDDLDIVRGKLEIVMNSLRTVKATFG